jgi:hypothetical protein
MLDATKIATGWLSIRTIHKIHIPYMIIFQRVPLAIEQLDIIWKLNLTGVWGERHLGRHLSGLDI